MNKYKVVIVDDDEVAIGKLSDALKKNPRFSIEGTARNDKQGKKLIVVFGCGNVGYSRFGFVAWSARQYFMEYTGGFLYGL